MSEVNLHCPSLSNVNPSKIVRSFTSYSLSNGQTLQTPTLELRSFSGNEVSYVDNSRLCGEPFLKTSTGRDQICFCLLKEAGPSFWPLATLFNFSQKNSFITNLLSAMHLFSSFCSVQCILSECVSFFYCQNFTNSLCGVFCSDHSLSQFYHALLVKMKKEKPTWLDGTFNPHSTVYFVLHSLC